MLDENTTPVVTNPSSSAENGGGVASDLPPATIEKHTANPITAQNNPASGLSKDNSPSVLTSAHQARHGEPRICIRWPAEALIDGKGVYKGFVKGISLRGTNIYLDVNLQKVKSVKLRIHVPSLGKLNAARVMEVSANVIYTAYDGNESLFHAGLNFTQFKLASDQAYLQSRLTPVKQ
jgi:hypothetical protein